MQFLAFAIFRDDSASVYLVFPVLLARIAASRKSPVNILLFMSNVRPSNAISLGYIRVFFFFSFFFFFASRRTRSCNDFSARTHRASHSHRARFDRLVLHRRVLPPQKRTSERLHVRRWRRFSGRDDERQRGFLSFSLTPAASRRVFCRGASEKRPGTRGRFFMREREREREDRWSYIVQPYARGFVLVEKG